MKKFLLTTLCLLVLALPVLSESATSINIASDFRSSEIGNGSKITFQILWNGSIFCAGFDAGKIDPAVFIHDETFQYSASEFTGKAGLYIPTVSSIHFYVTGTASLQTLKITDFLEPEETMYKVSMPKLGITLGLDWLLGPLRLYTEYDILSSREISIFQNSFKIGAGLSFGSSSKKQKSASGKSSKYSVYNPNPSIQFNRYGATIDFYWDTTDFKNDSSTKVYFYLQELNDISEKQQIGYNYAQKGCFSITDLSSFYYLKEGSCYKILAKIGENDYQDLLLYFYVFNNKFGFSTDDNYTITVDDDSVYIISERDFSNNRVNLKISDYINFINGTPLIDYDYDDMKNYRGMSLDIQQDLDSLPIYNMYYVYVDNVEIGYLCW